MKEDFLHYVWKFQKLKTLQLVTVSGEPLVVVNPGQHNHNSGPDFFNAQVRIGEQLWAGNVEIHTKSSDWYIHGHETDRAYDNVILHVVWEDDASVFRKDNSEIATFALREYIDDSLVIRYDALMSQKADFIKCERSFGWVDDFILENWLERLYVERLERKAAVINEFLKQTQNDWEAVLFQMLAKNFGLKVNGDAFLSMAKSIDYSIVRKAQKKQLSLEALFLGQSRLLEVEPSTEYSRKLVEEYAFLKSKFKLSNDHIVPVQFFRLRPPNFPTIRLSQLASLYSNNQSLFTQLNRLQSLSEIRELFKIGCSPFWTTHYTFNKQSRFSEKRLSESFIDLLIINTIIPLRFCYLKSLGSSDFSPILELAATLPGEENTIVNNYEHLRAVKNSALHSQGLLELYNEYCIPLKCMQCAVGSELLKSN